jgi:PAS domain S-box-containing protein
MSKKQNSPSGARAPQTGSGAPADEAADRAKGNAGRAEGQQGADHPRSEIERRQIADDADMTERKEAELALAQLADIIESSEDAIYAVDIDGVITYWNRGAEGIYGYTTQEATGQSLMMLIPPERHEMERDILERLRRGERIKRYESVRRRKDGSHVDISLTVSPMKNAQGEVIGTSRIARDITERKRAEEAQAHLAAVVEHSRDPIISKSPDGTVTSWNSAAEALFGYSAAEMIGQSVRRIIPPELMAEEDEILDRLRAGQSVEHFETERLTKDGRRVPVSLTISPIKDATGLVVGASKVVHDITERKRAEEELRRARLRLELSLQASGAVTWGWNVVEDRLDEWTPQYRRLYGFAPDESTTVETWLTRVHPDDRARLSDRVQQILDTPGDDEWNEEFRVIHPELGERWIFGLGRAFRDEAGRVLRMTGVNLDITGRKRQEEERSRLLASERYAREQAEAANRLKDEFLATVSHELRSPLNAILGWARMLRDKRLDEEGAAHALEVIYRSARAQNRLIGDLLDVSRIITGKLRLQVSVVDLIPITEAAMDVVRPAADARGIKLISALDRTAGPVSGDADRLQQIIWNLLSNAVKFTPAGGQVMIRLEREGGGVTLTVSDTGVGIEPEFLPFVFDRFRQFASEPARPSAGLGLGLAIVRHLVELHGGVVSAASRGRGQGATFTVAFPLAAGRQEWSEARRGRPAGAGEIPQGRASAPDRLRDLRVLVVDDEPDARDLLGLMLTSHGAEVRACASAAEALRTLDEWRPDVLVFDIGMPGEDGYELMRKVRARGPERGGHIPAIALTAYARAEDARRALKAGYQTHVAKPIEPVELATVVASLAGRGGREESHEESIDEARK